MHEKNLAVILTASIRYGAESGEIAQMNAAHEIVAAEQAYGFDGLFREILHNVVDFLMVAAPAFHKCPWRATGRNREQWLALLD